MPTTWKKLQKFSNFFSKSFQSFSNFQKVFRKIFKVFQSFSNCLKWILRYERALKNDFLLTSLFFHLSSIGVETYKNSKILLSTKMVWNGFCAIK